MDMFNKLKSSLSGTMANTITNTVYNTSTMISGVLPGNPVTRDYEVTAHVASAGPCLLWKVYSGVKKSTRQPASVFVLEKAALDRLDRQERDLVWDLMKKGVGQLTRLRHPQVLTVQHPLEESRDCLAFATEPVFASLANVLGSHDNLPSPTPHELRGFKMFDVEIKYGLLQISEGLGFLHGSAKMVHRNLSPESILINQQGAWKIAGFEYCLPNKGQPGHPPSWDFPEYDHSLPPESYPQLDYTAPEYAMLGSITPAADMFSYGMLALAVNTKRSLYSTNRMWGEFKRQAKDLRGLPPDKLSSVPPDLVNHLKLLISPTPDLRPSPEQVQQLPFFEDFGVKTLTNLDSQFQWDNQQKSQFYKGLPGILPKLPHRVALHRVFPCLAKEFSNPDMVPFVLPSGLQIAEQASREDFVAHILPELKSVMKLMEPIQILLIFMQKMDLLLDKTPSEDVKSDVLPMVYRAIESDVSQIQELCLTIIPSFAGLLDPQSLKTALLPRVKKLCISTTLLSVRVNSLICIGKLLEHMDKWQVIDDVLPIMAQIPSKEPAVVMAIVGIYKLTFTNSKLGLTKEVIANKVLPFLIPLSIENGLTVSQYTSITSLIKEMLAKVESEHRTKLEQLNSVRDNQNKTLMTAVTSSPGQLVAAPTMQEVDSMDSMFTGLGLGTFVSQDKGELVNKALQPANITNTKVTTSPVSQEMSLQEKQRILAEQEAAQSRQSINNQKDLTETLTTKSVSMNQMTSRSSSSWGDSLLSPSSSGLASLGPSISSNYTINSGPQQGLGVGLTPQQAPTATLRPQQAPTASLTPQQAPTASLRPQQAPTASLRPQQAPTATLRPQQSASKPDLSAFDSLLSPTSSTQHRLPMNMLNSGSRGQHPLLPSQSGQQLPKPLSSSDINDLLG